MRAKHSIGAVGLAGQEIFTGESKGTERGLAYAFRVRAIEEIGRRKVEPWYCCIMGVSFSVALFLRAAALISLGAVVML